MGSVRVETDSMGPVEVPADRYWGAQTQRSLQNFKIGGHRFSAYVVRAFGIVKKASAITNHALGKLDDYANANSVQKLLQAPELEAARRDFRDAGAATKTRGDELGIACPGMTL